MAGTHWRHGVRRKAATAAALIVAVCVGCSDGRPKRVPVMGKVTIDGAPLKFGQVLFHVHDHRPAMARLNEAGEFQLSTYEKGDGCVLGQHDVSVNAGEVINPTARRWFAPPKYAAPSTSGLTVEVNEEMDPVEIKLSWDGGKPFVERMSGGGD